MRMSPLVWLHFSPDGVPGFFIGLIRVDVAFRPPGRSLITRMARVQTGTGGRGKNAN